MSKLATLRADLARLRRRRQMVRWGIALAALLLSLLGVLVVAFAMDWFFDMTRLQRLFLILLGMAALYGAYRRFVRPWLVVRESDIDMALLVAQQHEIDSDLVAALQFEGSEAEQWGSAQLRHAVIDYVADFAKGLNVLQGFSARGLLWRVGVLSLALLAVGLFGAAHGNYLRAFVNRICLGSARYPTRTVLDQVTVNGQPVDLVSEATPVRIPSGTPIHLAVLASGDLPEAGKVVIKPRNGGSASTVKLAADGGVQYGAHLPEIVDALELEISLGDARTGPIRIEAMPLPVVEITAKVTVPDYAHSTAAGSAPQNARQLTVLEGSRIDLQVVCRNKSLSAAIITIEGVEYPLTRVSIPEEPGCLWTLAGAHSPLSAVTHSLRYEVQVMDQDGLHLPKPLEGSIRVKSDQRPRIAGKALTRLVLPTARPVIHYRADDDYGITQLLAHLDVVRKDGPSDLRRTVSIQEFANPLLRDRLPLKGVFQLDLASLRLTKGDHLTVTLETIDYRGAANGQSGSSEPIVFEITDQAGILEDIARPDYQSAEELDAIIRYQLNIGDAK